MSEMSQGPGWWQASDGKWYPPEQAPPAVTPPPAGMPSAPPYSATGPGPAAPAGGSYSGQFGQLAVWGQRATAFAIDVAIVFGILIVGAIIATILGAISSALGALAFAILYIFDLGAWLYWGYLNGAKGQTPGKALTGLKVISMENGEIIGGGSGVLRQIFHIVDSIVCYIGWFMPLWDSDRQTIADKLAKTVVIVNIEKQAFGPDLFKP